MPRARYDPEQTRELKWLGQALAALRKKAGLTQRQLAERAGRPFSQVADIERGANSPGWLLLVHLCRTLGVTMADLGRAYDEAQGLDARPESPG